MKRQMKQTFEPLGDRVMIERVESVTKTPGGLLIPDNFQDKPTEGIVIAVGPGRVDEHGSNYSMNVGTGDRVLFAKHRGTEIKLNGDTYLIMPEGDILGILR